MNALALSARLALRYAGFGGAGLGRFIARLAMAGFVVGVAVLIAVLSVMNGFERELRERILRVVPAVVVSVPAGQTDWQPLADTLRAHPQVQQAFPFVEAQVLVSAGAQTRAALLYGVDAARESMQSPYAEFLDGAPLSELLRQQQGVYLGDAVATQLGVNNGDHVLLVAAGNGGHEASRFQRFTVLGRIRTGTELDQHLLLASREAVAELKWAERERVDGLRLAVDDVLAAPQIAFDLYVQQGGRYTVSDWTRSHGNLHEAIRLSKQLVALVLVVLVLVAGFNVVSGLVLLVNEKRPDIALLKTLGLSPTALLFVFACLGLLVGVIGVGSGVLLGIGLAWSLPMLVSALENLMGFRFLSTEVYPVNFLPSELQWGDVLWVALVSLAIALLVSLYPAWRASRVMPAQALRQDV